MSGRTRLGPVQRPIAGGCAPAAGARAARAQILSIFYKIQPYKMPSTAPTQLSRAPRLGTFCVIIDTLNLVERMKESLNELAR